MVANIVFQFFLKGGPGLWPFMLSALAAVAVVGERTFWWWRESRKRDVPRREKLLAALENSDVEEAQRFAQGSEDPVIRMIRQSLNHEHTSIPVALQMAAGIEMERAGRFLNVMDTLVTLAPRRIRHDYVIRPTNSRPGRLQSAACVSVTRTLQPIPPSFVRSRTDVLAMIPPSPGPCAPSGVRS